MPLSASARKKEPTRCVKCNKFLTSSGECAACAAAIKKLPSAESLASLDSCEDPTTLRSILDAVQSLAASFNVQREKTDSKINQLIESHEASYNLAVDTSNKVAALEMTIAGLLATNESLKEDNAILKKRVIALEAEVERNRQDSLKSTLELRGVPSKPEENLVAICQEVGRAVGVPLSAEDFSNVYRVGRTSRSSSSGPADPRPGPIFLTLVRQHHAELLLAGFKSRGWNLSTRNIGWKDNDNHAIHLSQSLSPYFRKIYHTARLAKQAKKIKYLWVKNGRIFARKSDGAPAVALEHPSDVNSL